MTPAWEMASDIGRRLKDLRTALGWTQSDLGREVGRKSYKTISEWEAGVRAPDPDLLETLARRHGWPLAIFAEGGPMPSEWVSAEGVSSETYTLQPPRSRNVTSQVRESTPSYPLEEPPPPEHDLVREIVTSPAAFTRRLNTMVNSGVPGRPQVIEWLKDVEEILRERGLPTSFIQAERRRVEELGD